MIVNGEPITTGVFTVDANGTLSQSSFDIDAEDLDAASTFVLTIEPSPDADPMPSSTHVLAGDFVDRSASLTIKHDAAIATDFLDAEGTFVIATPSDGNGDIDEESGVWFLDNSTGTALAGLDLPTLPDGWNYEGWVVIDGTPVTTGTFQSGLGSDNFSAYSGSEASPPFPGEDFLQNAPDGLDFPVDLTGKTVVISVEPSPDNSLAPFTLKPLVKEVDGSQETHTAVSMNNNASVSEISGVVER